MINKDDLAIVGFTNGGSEIINWKLRGPCRGADLILLKYVTMIDFNVDIVKSFVRKEYITKDFFYRYEEFNAFINDLEGFSGYSVNGFLGPHQYLITSKPVNIDPIVFKLTTGCNVVWQNKPFEVWLKESNLKLELF